MSIAEACRSALGPLVAERERAARDVEKLDRLIHTIETLDAPTAAPAGPPQPFVCEHPGCTREFGTSQARSGHMSSHVMKDRRQKSLDDAVAADQAKRAELEQFNADARAAADARITAAWHAEHDLPAPAGEELGTPIIIKPEPLAPPFDQPGNMPPPVEYDQGDVDMGIPDPPQRFTPAPWPKAFPGVEKAAALVPSLVPSGLPAKPIDVDKARARAYEGPDNEIKNQ